jgi:hypothetical protein
MHYRLQRSSPRHSPGASRIWSGTCGGFTGRGQVFDHLRPPGFLGTSFKYLIFNDKNAAANIRDGVFVFVSVFGCRRNFLRLRLLDFCFFELDVLAHDGVILFHDHLFGHGARVLLGYVEIASVRGALKLDFDRCWLSHWPGPAEELWGPKSSKEAGEARNLLIMLLVSSLLRCEWVKTLCVAGIWR